MICMIDTALLSCQDPLLALTIPTHHREILHRCRSLRLHILLCCPSLQILLLSSRPLFFEEDSLVDCLIYRFGIVCR